MLYILSYIIYTFLALPGSYGLGRCVVLHFFVAQVQVASTEALGDIFQRCVEGLQRSAEGGGRCRRLPIAFSGVRGEWVWLEGKGCEWVALPRWTTQHGAIDSLPSCRGRGRRGREAWRKSGRKWWPWPKWGPMCPSCVTVTKVRPYVPKLCDRVQSEAVCAQGPVSYTDTHPVYPVICSRILANASYMELSFVAREADKKTLHTHTQLSSCVRNHERLWSIGLTWSSQPVETKELGAKNAHTNAASLWKKGEKKTLKCWRQQHGHWTDLCFIHNQNMERTSKTA